MTFAVYPDIYRTLRPGVIARSWCDNAFPFISGIITSVMRRSIFPAYSATYHRIRRLRVHISLLCFSCDSNKKTRHSLNWLWRVTESWTGITARHFMANKKIYAVYISTTSCHCIVRQASQKNHIIQSLNTTTAWAHNFFSNSMHYINISNIYYYIDMSLINQLLILTQGERITHLVKRWPVTA